MAREGDGALKTGEPRIRITVETREEALAVCKFERLHDKVELEPYDMAAARRALESGFRTYKRERMKELDAQKQAAPAEEGPKEDTVLGSGFVVDREETETAGSMMVEEPGVSVIEKEGEGFDE